MVRCPATSASAIIVTDLMVLMAEIASAPASTQAAAGSVICVMLGVIFGMTGIFTALFTQAV